MSNEINQSQNTKRKVYGSIFIVLVLSVMLALTTVALFASVLTSEDNFFETAQVKIDVNDGQVLFDGNMHIEPGMTLKEDLVIKNLSTVDVYYRLYLENVDGALKDALIFKIYDGEELLYSASAADFSEQNPFVGQEILQPDQTKTLSLCVRMKETAGNMYQQQSIQFDLSANAVQAKNNPDKEF